VEINPLDGDQLFVSTKVEIYRSNNKGTNWDDITGNLLGESYSLGLCNNVNPELYVGGSGSFIYRIEDARNAEPGDDEENRITHSSPIAFRGSFISCIKVDPTNPNTIYCGMSNMTTNPRIWRINDANSANPTYESLHSNLPPRLPINSIEIDPENPEFIMIASDYGMYTSNTSGGWWEKEDRIPNVHVTQLRLRHSDRKLFIYTYGRGIWTADLKDNPSAGLKPDPETSFKLYPNPASSFVNIEAKEFSYYALYNSKGDLVATESSKKIIVSSLPNGIYILEVYSPSGRRVKKLIVSH
jgi:hypothetical protein